jgi:hypothetical protein
MNRPFWTLLLGLSLGSLCAAQPGRTLYQNDFSQSEIGGVPADFLVLEGAFAVRSEGQNNFLELPGAPLDNYGVLFGPAEKENVSVSARIYGTATGRRSPAFAVGLNGAAGYRLQVSPGRKQLELVRADRIVKSVPYEWRSGKWTRLRLQVHKTPEGHWKIEGRAWPEDNQEPAEWMIAVVDERELPTGRASVFGSPFSGTPLRFDDLRVERIAPR